MEQNPDIWKPSVRGTGPEEVLIGRVDSVLHNPSKGQSLLRSAWLTTAIAHEEGGVRSPSSPFFKLRKCSMVPFGAGESRRERVGSLAGAGAPLRGNAVSSCCSLPVPGAPGWELLSVPALRNRHWHHWERQKGGSSLTRSCALHQQHARGFSWSSPRLPCK